MVVDDVWAEYGLSGTFDTADLYAAARKMAERLATLTAANARLREDAVKKLCEDADVQWVCVSYDNDATDGLPWCVDVKRRKGMSYEYWAATYDDAISVAFDDLDNARAQGWP